MKRTSLWAAGAIAAGLAFGGAAQATPFDGVFDPANWTFDAGGADGSVDVSGAPNSILLAGNDDDQEDVFTTFSIVVGSDTTFTFFWNYLTTDVDGPSFDPFGYFIGDTNNLTQLSDDGGPDGQSGFESVDLLSGDVFGFYILSTDGALGRAFASFGDEPEELFIAETPEPAMLGLFGAGLLGLVAARRRRAAA